MFENEIHTDEFIQLSTIIIFFGILTFSIEIEMVYDLFLSIYVGQIVSFVLYAYIMIEGIFYFKNTMSFNRIFRSMLLLIFIMILFLYIQNVVVMQNIDNAFSGINLNRFFELLYYTITNVTSVGFGDITPNCYYAKIVSMESSVFGYIMFFSFISLFVAKTSEINNIQSRNECEKESDA